MSESQSERRRHHDQESEEVETQESVQAQESAQASEDDFDSLLDDIDGVLEVNAEEFVRSFVQKGGQ